MRNKLYNIGAYGIPMAVVHRVSKWEFLSLRWTKHAQREALNDKHGVMPSCCYPSSFQMEKWSLVEVEVNLLGHPVKIVVRRSVDASRSLVLVILADGTVKTCWTNINTDNHSTLDKSKFSKI